LYSFHDLVYHRGKGGCFTEVNERIDLVVDQTITMEELNKLSEQILKCAFKVHTALGPGLLESSYKECLYYVLNKNGLYTEKEKALPLTFEEIKMDVGYRVDLMVDRKVIIEIKAIESFANIHTAQVLTYLKLSDCKLGLLLNFHTVQLKNGIKRLVL
jgi:GxxExxY protein